MTALRLRQAGFVAVMLFVVVMALVPRPPVLVPQLWDKWQHMAAFATLALLAALAFPQAGMVRIGERLSFLGALIEVAQASPLVGRDCDLLDWVADTVAVAVVLALVSWWRRRGAT